MNAPLKHEVTEDQFAHALDETHRLLQSVKMYCKCAQDHLELRDIPVAIWDFEAIGRYLETATYHFAVLRAAYREKNKPEDAA